MWLLMCALGWTEYNWHRMNKIDNLFSDQNYCFEPRVVLNMTPHHMCPLEWVKYNCLNENQIKLYDICHVVYAKWTKKTWFLSLYQKFQLSFSLLPPIIFALSLSCKREKKLAREKIGRHLENGYDQIQRNFKFQFFAYFSSIY